MLKTSINEVKDNEFSIKNCFELAKSKENVELEFIIQEKLTYSDFIRLLNRFKMLSQSVPSQYTENEIMNYMNVYYEGEKRINTRNIIYDLNSYCRTNNASHSKSEFKKNYFDTKNETPIYQKFKNFYNIRMNLKYEISYDNIEDIKNLEISSTIKDTIIDEHKLIVDENFKSKKFRNIQRFCFETKNKMFRIDFSILHTSTGKTFLNSNFQETPYEYEVEIEYIPDESHTYEDFMINLQHELYRINQCIQRTIKFIPQNEQKQILQEYEKLQNELFDSNVKGVLNSKPIGLEEKDMKTILNNKYSVTAKADGETRLLYINSEGKVYFITMNKKVTWTGVKIDSYKNSILNGEFIDKSKNNETVYQYFAFDAYAVNGNNISKGSAALPHISLDKKKKTRVHFIAEVVKAISKALKSQNPYFNIHTKNFMIPKEESIIKLSKKIWDKREEFSFELDGLIYTPIDKEIVFGTWHEHFKWKPKEFLSIDFLVEKNVENIKLMVGKTINGKYQPDTKNPFDILNTNSNYDSIRSNTIVEMVYDSFNKKWNVLRTREDKTAGYLKWKEFNEKNPKKTNPYNIGCNSIKVAQQIIRLIKSNFAPFEDNKSYYTETSKTKRSKSVGINIRNYHNIAKNWLYKISNKIIKSQNKKDKNKDKKTLLLDIGSGRGGDIAKWYNNNFNSVVAVEPNKSNIVNKHGLVDRKEKFMKRKLKKEFNISIIHDGGQNATLVERVNSLTKEPFDVVSIQFAIHYLLKSENDFKTLLDNIQKLLKKNGILILSLMDGKLLFEKLNENEGIYDKWEKTGYYFKLNENCSSLRNYNCLVDAKIESINSDFDAEPISEPLVDIDFLTSKLKDNGFEYLSKTEVSEMNDKTTSIFSMKDIRELPRIKKEMEKKKLALSLDEMNISDLFKVIIMKKR